VEYSTEKCSVDAGDLLMTFTDGLVEVENANAEAFSMDRLGESIRRGAGLPVTKLMQDIFSDIRRFADRVEFSDDVCLVGMEISRLQPSHA
jgi:serine phosphatase RsbU (regulator of sigma subunit)